MLISTLYAIYKACATVTAALEEVIRQVVSEMTEDCFRVKKAIVQSAPNGSVCRVKLVGDDTILSLPYSSDVSSVGAGAVVWVAILGSSMRNAIVWQTANFR